MNPLNAAFLQFQNDNDKKVFLRLNALSDGDGEDEEMQSVGWVNIFERLTLSSSTPS